MLSSGGRRGARGEAEEEEGRQERVEVKGGGEVRLQIQVKPDFLVKTVEFV